MSEPGATATSTLPIISITPYLPSAPAVSAAERAHTAAALHAACRDYGFFYLDISDYASPAETDELAALGRAFFALDEDTKAEIGIWNEDYARGISCRAVRPFYAD